MIMNNLTEIIPNTLAESLGITIMHSLWQIALIGLFLWFALFLARKAKAVVRYRLAMGGLLLMVAFPVITFLNHSPEATSIVETNVVSATNLSIAGPDLLPMAVVHDTVGGVAEQLSAFFTQNASWISMLWLLGMVFFAVRLIGGYMASRRLRSRGVSPVSFDLQDKLQQLARQMGIRMPVRIMQSTKISSPLVMGSLKPMVLIPASIIGQMQPSQMEYILLHELAHIRRWDYLANIVQSLAEVLLFFHPVVWLVSKQIRQERENCCDELVLTYNEDKIQYAKALLSLETMRQSGSGMAMAANGGKLFQRIRRITGNPDHKPRRSQGVLALLLVLTLIVGISAGPGFKAQIPMDPTFGELTLSDPQVIKVEEEKRDRNNSRVVLGKKTCDSKTVKKDKKSNNPLPLLFNLLEEKVSNLGELVEFIPSNGTDNVFQFVSNLDTPETSIVIMEDDGTKIEMKLDSRGKVSSAKVNGENVDREDLSQYQARVDEAFRKIPEPPRAPGNPQMRGMNEEAMVELDLKMEELTVKLAEMGEHLGAELGEQLGNSEMWEELATKLEHLTEGLVVELKDIDPDWSEEEWEKWGEKMESWGESQENEWEEFGEEMEKWGEKFAEKWEAKGEDWEKFGEEMEEWAEKFEVEMEEWAEKHEGEIEQEIEMELAEDMRRLKEEMKVKEGELKKKFGSMGDDLRGNLESDNLIKDGDRFKLEMKNGKMFVNGKKQSNDTYRKYRKILSKYHSDSDGDITISQSKKK